jgi:DNA-binding HxlR family transcriptional regulator
MPRRKTLKTRAPGAGRKPKPELRLTQISTSVTPTLAALLQAGAKDRGLSLSQHCAELLAIAILS